MNVYSKQICLDGCATAPEKHDGLMLQDKPLQPLLLTSPARQQPSESPSPAAVLGLPLQPIPANQQGSDRYVDKPC